MTAKKLSRIDFAYDGAFFGRGGTEQRVPRSICNMFALLDFYTVGSEASDDLPNINNDVAFSPSLEWH